MEAADASQIARSQEEREQLAKEWLLQMIDRTPLPEVGELPVPWVVEEAPPLIADILRALAEPEEATATELEPAQRRRAETLAALRDGPRAASQIPRDLATLQPLLLEASAARSREREPGDFARAAGRLADDLRLDPGRGHPLAGREPRGRRRRTIPSPGCPAPVQLDEWLRVLLAEQRRYGHPFALALVDVDGLARINEAYGRGRPATGCWPRSPASSGASSAMSTRPSASRRTSSRSSPRTATPRAWSRWRTGSRS